GALAGLGLDDRVDRVEPPCLGLVTGDRQADPDEERVRSGDGVHDPADPPSVLGGPRRRADAVDLDALLAPGHVAVLVVSAGGETTGCGWFLTGFTGTGITIAVSIRSSPLRPRSDCRPLRGRSRRSAWLTLASGPVRSSAMSRSVPAGWL